MGAALEGMGVSGAAPRVVERTMRLEIGPDTLFRDAMSFFAAAEGMSQSDIAEKLGVSRSLVNHWATGDRLPPAGRMADLACALGCEERDLPRRLPASR